MVSHNYINQIGHEKPKAILSSDQLKATKFYPLKFKSYHYQFISGKPVQLPEFEMLKKPEPSTYFNEFYSGECKNARLDWAEKATVIAKLTDKKIPKHMRMFLSIPDDASDLKKSEAEELKTEYKKYYTAMVKKYSNESCCLSFDSQDGDLTKVAAGNAKSSRAYKSAGNVYVLLLANGDFSSDQNLVILQKSPSKKWIELENFKISGDCD